MWKYENYDDLQQAAAAAVFHEKQCTLMATAKKSVEKFMAFAAIEMPSTANAL